MKASNWMKICIMGLGFACAGSLPAQAEDAGASISGDMGVYSQYVWRGVPQGAGQASVQGDLGMEANGFSLTSWFASLGDPNNASVVEFDWTLDYSGEVDALGYSLGGIYYTYLNNAALNFGEYYLGLSYDAAVSPSATAYYNNKTRDYWLDLGLGGSVQGFDLAATISYARYKNTALKDEFETAAFTISKDVTLDQVVFTPSLAVMVALGDRNIYGTGVNKNAVVFGVNMSY